ncbi:MAG: acetate--CoA ligase family protein [Acidobacteria bacterium]|jgi:acyl-CoA synthetase (NDP forming)|nr:acetate--CoA ligase family protein [Acidobacteriota bacterium]
MAASPHQAIHRILEAAHTDGRRNLFEHECYRLLAQTGAEAAPVTRLIQIGSLPNQGDLDAIPGERVVLKVVSPDITHKTEAHGVRIVAKEIGAVEAAFQLMVREVPEVYAAHLISHSGDVPLELAGLDRGALQRRLQERMVGILLCQFVPADAQGFATELFVGIRATAEFGPIISAGLGGVEMEILARASRPGAAVAIAPTGLVDGRQFFDLFRQTLSYQRLAGEMRGARRQVADDLLVECFQAFIDLANRFSSVDPEARFHITELEVNPFVVSGGHLAPVDGLCSFQPAQGSAGQRPLTKIGALLRPRSAAVIGVSASSMNMGRIILNNIVGGGFPPDRAYVVRPGSESIDGVRCVDSIATLPEKVDLLVVAVGASQVPEVVAEVLDHDRANAVILIPGGLGEKEGSQELERELKRRIQEAHATGDGGPVFLGGNSLGVISHPGSYDTMFIPDSKLPKSSGDHARSTCFLSQSGAFIITNLSRMPWFDPAYALSIGNQIDLTAGDLLSYLKNDTDIEVVAVYMEGFRPGDGLAFARAVKQAVALGKDVVFYKAGRTSEGRSATAGHTASVAGDYAVCEAALTQAGALVADDFEEFTDLLKLCVSLRGKTVAGNRLAAISNAGFEAVGMADSIKNDGRELVLASLSPAADEALRGALAGFRLDGLVDVKNPLDLTPMATDEAYASVVGTVLEDNAVDLVAVGIVPLTPALQTLPASEAWKESIGDERSIARLLPTVASAHPKPLLAIVDSGELFDPLATELERGGLAVFRAADRAVRALCKLVDVKLKRSMSMKRLPEGSER